MRRVLAGACLALLALSAGCGPFNKGGAFAPDAAAPRWNGTPKPEQLVAVLNQNAATLTSLEAKDAFIKARANGEEIGLGAYLACQKSARAGTPPNFRLQAQVLGTDEVDIGSNSEEFWFWIKRSPQPYVYHCSYADYPKVASRGGMPFPFQPEWVAGALGLAEYDPKAKYDVHDSGKTYDLIEQTTSPRGTTVAKVTSFHKTPRNGATPVAGYFLYELDAKRHYDLVCSAVISDSQAVPVASGRSIVLPREVRLTCPKEKMELTIDLGKLRANVPFDQERISFLFTRRTLGNYKSYDLARGLDTATGEVRPAGGILR